MRWKQAIEEIEDAGFRTERADRGDFETPGPAELHVVNGGYEIYEFANKRDWLEIVGGGELNGETVLSFKLKVDKPRNYKDCRIKGM